MNESAAEATTGKPRHTSREEFAAAREAAAATKRDLSWTPSALAAHNETLDEFGFKPVPAPDEVQEFVEYTGHPDGSFTVLVTMQRGQVAVSQTERGIGKRADQIREVYEIAYTLAERALVTLIDSDDEDDDE